jgi:hypothetical protein
MELVAGSKKKIPIKFQTKQPKTVVRKDILCLTQSKCVKKTYVMAPMSFLDLINLIMS